MRFELCVLGSSAAVPANGRFCSAHVLSLEHADFLIDCGEGTQIRLQQAGIGPGRIGCILISHLHGDHYFGLPGLLTSLMLGGRTEELRIFSPPGLQERIRLLLDLDGFTPSFPLTFVEIEVNEPQQIWEDKEIEILAFPLR
ncbi:MAG: MBL fold metallo-hydrolase, partial [Bacteroidota bacterium]